MYCLMLYVKLLLTIFCRQDVDMDMTEPILPARDEFPTKYISFDQSIAIKCMLQYIDFEGLTDGRSIRNILAKIAPRKLVCTCHYWVKADRLCLWSCLHYHLHV
jgi:cleavage and polyadenylation specificity factor subunit 2